MVYIQEAHSTTAWQMDKNEEDGVLFADPGTFEERTAIATSCVADLGIEFPAVVDSINNRTELAYTAWPERIYLIDTEGRVVLKSQPGPFGFEPDDLKGELEKLFPDVPELPDEEEGDGDEDKEEGQEDDDAATTPPLLR